MTYHDIVFSRHAIKRMFERNILPRHVRHVLSAGETIADYPDDHPYPSKLMLCSVEGRPVHVVVAINSVANRYEVITAYIPEPDKWESDFRKRRTS